MKHNPVIAMQRNQTAKALRSIHKALIHGRSKPDKDLCSCSTCEVSQEEQKVMDYTPWAILWGSLVLALCFIASCEQPAHAYTDQEAIKTIVGEASNQGYTGMVAVAEVIRTKGYLKGFC